MRTLVIVAGSVLGTLCLVACGILAFVLWSAAVNEYGQAGPDGLLLATKPEDAITIAFARQRDNFAVEARQMLNQGKVVRLSPGTAFKVTARISEQNFSLLGLQVISGPHRGAEGYHVEWLAAY